MNRLPNFLEVAAGSTVNLAFNYTLLAGVMWILCYIVFRRRWLHRKIVSRFPTSPEVRREIRYSLLSMVIFALSGAATVELARRGWTQMYWRVDQHGWTWFWLSVGLTILLHDTYFYWSHRLMHHRRLFRWFHRTHHLSHNPSPWAAYAFDPLEAVAQSLIFPMAVLLYPIHPLAFAIFMGWQITYNILGHTGYEFHPKWLMKTPLRFILNTPTNHIMHHEKMQGNYGLYFNIWDRIGGTNHRDYEKRFEEITSRPGLCSQVTHTATASELIHPAKS